MSIEVGTAYSSSVVFKHGILAVFGAIVHALVAFRRGEARTVLDVVILAIISSFAGVMFAMVALYIASVYTLGPSAFYLTGAAAGMGGWLGIEGMALFQPVLSAIFERIRFVLTGNAK